MLMKSTANPFRTALALLACAASLLLPARADAQLTDTVARLKIAPDLLTTIGSSAAPALPWAKLLGGEMLVRALVVANSDDPALTSLRQYIVNSGGSVYYNYVSIRALAVMLPA